MRLHPDAFRAVVEGEHGDPFAVLGPHRVQTPDGAAVAVRAIVPGAAAVRVLPADGHVKEIEDPYRFPSLLSDFDRHLLAEGTHYRAHEKPGAHPAVLDGVRGIAFAVWARRPASAGASRLGHAHLRLRTQRGRELPARQRALLA